MHVGDLEEMFIQQMMRTMFVLEWIHDEEENQDRCYPGCELMAVAPPIPERHVTEYREWAIRLIGQIEGLNARGRMPKPLWQLFQEAVIADNDVLCRTLDHYLTEDLGDRRKKYITDYGHYLVMQALGHGVCWTDDHEDYGYKSPSIEEPDIYVSENHKE